MSGYQWHLPPPAWDTFCQKYPADAGIKPGVVGPRDQLETVNARVNKIARQVGKPNGPDVWLLWPSRAWCHDYAVTKRHELLTLGWPSSSLLITECRTAQGEAHCVLIADGLVLDNRTTKLLAKDDTGYDWSLPEQQADDPDHWEKWQS